jgi:hypothetical protein
MGIADRASPPRSCKAPANHCQLIRQGLKPIMFDKIFSLLDILLAGPVYVRKPKPTKAILTVFC